VSIIPRALNSGFHSRAQVLYVAYASWSVTCTEGRHLFKPVHRGQKVKPCLTELITGWAAICEKLPFLYSLGKSLHRCWRYTCRPTVNLLCFKRTNYERLPRYIPSIILFHVPLLHITNRGSAFEDWYDLVMMMCDGLVIYEVDFRPSLSSDVVFITEIPNSSGKVFKINWERLENKPLVFH